jgi:hypothetical protein
MCSVFALHVAMQAIHETRTGRVYAAQDVCRIVFKGEAESPEDLVRLLSSRFADQVKEGADRDAIAKETRIENDAAPVVGDHYWALPQISVSDLGEVIPQGRCQPVRDLHLSLQVAFKLGVVGGGHRNGMCDEQWTLRIVHDHVAAESGRAC